MRPILGRAGAAGFGPAAWLLSWALLTFGACAAGVLVYRVDSWLLLTLVATSGFCASLVGLEPLLALMVSMGFLAGALRLAYGSWAAYAIPDLLVALVLLRWAGGQSFRKHAALGGSPATLPFWFLVLYCSLELLNPEAPFIRSVFGLRSWLMYTVLLLVGYAGYRDERQFDRLARVVIVLGVVTGAYGIWQWLHGIKWLVGLGGWYASLGSGMVWASSEAVNVLRAPSTFVLSTTFALNMALIVILTVSHVLSSRTSQAWKVFCFVGMITMGAGIAVSGSRAGPAYLVFGLGTILVLFRQFRMLTIVVPAIGLTFLVVARFTGGIVAQRFATLADPQVYLWKWALPLQTGLLDALEHPFGYGLGFAIGLPQLVTGESFEGLSTGAVIDSGYGAVAAELGLPGLLLFIWFTASLSIAAFRAWSSLSCSARDLFLGPAVWAAVLPLVSPLIGPHASPPLSMYQWLFIGMLLRAGTLAHVRREAQPPHARPRGALWPPAKRDGR